MTSNPVVLAASKLLWRLGPHFSNGPQPEATDAERTAITRLVNGGLVEAECAIEIEDTERQRAATIILRIKEGYAQPKEWLLRAVVGAGWYREGDKITSTVKGRIATERLRLTSEGEIAAADLRAGSTFPLDWVFSRWSPKPPSFVVMGVEHRPFGKEAKTVSQASERSAVEVRVELNPKFELTNQISLTLPPAVSAPPYSEQKARNSEIWQTVEEIDELLPRLAASNCSVLILGETGVGKEFYAQKIHTGSSRKAKPFRAINCEMLPKERIDAELYGHVKGAFTGAIQDRPGRILEAEGGTILLDELGVLPEECWGNLLRFLQEREIAPVGGATKQVNVRVLAATNNPQALPLDVSHRFDFTLRLPPLRVRRDQIAELAKKLFEQSVRDHDRTSLRFTNEELQRLATDEYPWPGNIRQLKKAIHSAVLLHRGDRNLTAAEVLAMAKSADNPE